LKTADLERLAINAAYVPTSLIFGFDLPLHMHAGRKLLAGIEFPSEPLHSLFLFHVNL